MSREDYAEKVIEDMDLNTLAQFAYDCLLDNIQLMTDEDFDELVKINYEEEV